MTDTARLQELEDREQIRQIFVDYVQIGRISAFGLLEMSRQRLRPSLLEHSTEICPHCAGTGRIRSIESAALHALRAIEEEGVRRRAGEIMVSVPPNVALYLLNQKRHTLTEIEKRYGFQVSVEADDELHAADCEIERVRGQRGDRDRPALELARASYDEVAGEARPPIDEADPLDVREPAMAGDAGGERGEDEDGEGRRRRRRRRRRPRRDGEAKARPPIVRRPLPARTIRPTSRRMTWPRPTPTARRPTTTAIRARAARSTDDGPGDGERPADGKRDGDGAAVAADAAAADAGAARTAKATPGDHAPREHGHHDQGHHDQGHQDNGQREEYRAAEPNAAIASSPHLKKHPRRRRSTTCRSTRWRADICRSSTRPTIPVRR